MTDLQHQFLYLLRLGIGPESPNQEMYDFNSCDWESLLSVARKHTVHSILLDGIERLAPESRPPKETLLHWIGQTMQEEQRYAVQSKTAAKLAERLQSDDIRTYVLKGQVVAECYPKPEHRESVDLDCFLAPADGEADVWEKGNAIVENSGYRVERGYYKNSSWFLPGLMVENHRWLTPFRGNKRLEALERLLQEMLRKDAGTSRFKGTCLYRPPVMVSALFLMEHAYSHFLHEGLTWRLVLDWMMFSQRHQEEIDWTQLQKWIDRFGFRKFYNSYVQLGAFLLGEISETDLSAADMKMLEDLWAALDLHESVKGLRGKLALAGNTFRARWKYKEFTDITWLQALWIQAKGFLFVGEPKL